jgi:S1-C subfamily serine protease
LNGKKVRSKMELSEIIAPLKPGQQISMRYYHKGTPVNTTLTLYEDPTLKIEKQAGTSVKQEEFSNKWIHGT